MDKTHQRFKPVTLHGYKSTCVRDGLDPVVPRSALSALKKVPAIQINTWGKRMWFDRTSLNQSQSSWEGRSLECCDGALGEIHNVGCNKRTTAGSYLHIYMYGSGEDTNQQVQKLVFNNDRKEDQDG